MAHKLLLDRANMTAYTIWKWLWNVRKNRSQNHIKISRVRTIQRDGKLAVGNISSRISCSVSYLYRCVSIHCKSWLTVGNYACDTNIVAECRWCPRDLFLKVIGLIWERCRTVLGWWRGHIWNAKKKKGNSWSTVVVLVREVLTMTRTYHVTT